MALYIPNSEELGRRRFPDNKEFRREVRDESINLLSQIEGLLPSNYPKDFNTNQAIFNRTIARELARIRWSNNAINNDKEYTETRIEYLQQILGERLFLTEQIAPANYNDETFRNYLISIKSAYLKGSKKEYIEDLASEFIGQQVNIRELYLLAREPGSSLDVSDTNMMVVDVLVEDSLRAGYNINSLLNDLDFFVNLVRPAHVLYDTRLIWAEQIDVNKIHDIYFGDTGGGCIPSYIFDPFQESTLLALQVFILPNSQGATGIIDSIHHEDLIFYLDDSTRVITEPGVTGTRIFNEEGRQVTFNALEIGQYVRITSQIITGDFSFWWYPSEILPKWESQFYKNVYRRPLFQEFVKKEMDANGRFALQTKTTPTTVCDRWVQDTLQPLYEDLRHSCEIGSEHAEEYTMTLSARMGKPRLSEPYSSDNMALPGNDYSYWMLDTPLTDGFSNPASVSDIMVNLDGTALPLQPVVGVDASTGKVQLSESVDYWDQTALTTPVAGDDLLFSYKYLLDGTNYDTTSLMVFGVSSWQMPNAPLTQGDGTGNLAGTNNIMLSVDGTQITNAVTDVTPLLGHVYLHQTADFWNSSELGRTPQIGDVFDFDFHWGMKYQYSAIYDELGRVLDGYVNSGMIYGIVLDGDLGYNPEISPVLMDSTTNEIGYRYRGYLLHHTSVLNSYDTLKLNEFQKPATRASIVNQANTLNHFNIFFSPEFLTDTSAVFLDDNYLENDLDPILKLNEGTPPFQKTFGYQPSLIYSRKLQDIRTNNNLLLYSDLLLKEFPENSGVHLSPICDSERTTFKIGMGDDTYAGLLECPPWILFDTAQVDNESVSIPGEYRGVPNLRVSGKNLREDFILREIEPTGSAQYIYTFQTPTDDDAPTEYYLPESFETMYDDELISYPALPIVDIDGNLATIADINVTVNGTLWTVLDLDPVTGWVQLAPYPEEPIIETYYTITAEDAARNMIEFPGYPIDPRRTTMTIIHGTAQYFEEDFFILDHELINYEDSPNPSGIWFLSWYGTPLHGLFEAGDIVRLSYILNNFADVPIQTTYYIRNTATVPLVNKYWSRILDNGDVYPGYCADMESIAITDEPYSEFYPGLDDFSDGIKMSFFNKDTLTVEEHLFSGPVFEYFEAGKDEIASPDNFPNALVKIPNPTSLGDPLDFAGEYGFLNDKVVRFRKKTYKELLPSRTFRTLELTEMMAV